MNAEASFALAFFVRRDMIPETLPFFFSHSIVGVLYVFWLNHWLLTGHYLKESYPLTTWIVLTAIFQH